ncbi:MAG: cardiolipin synthase [Aurantimonas endophytica]|uniref:cardiolipin synthase n=1 Tax=Aurantimonas endophytica TaxID=1522175 RepID=UPI00300257F9
MIAALYAHLGLIYLICEWIIRLAMLAVVPRRRNSPSARSWLLFIFFLPIPGIIIYAAIGRPAFARWRAERFRRLDPFFAETNASMGGLRRAMPDDQNRKAVELADSVGGFPPIGGNAIELMDGYDETIDRLVADIDAARHHVRLLVYIFADDATGTRVIDALARAVARGVKCHVLLDPVGSHRWRRGTVSRLRSAGVEVREALPYRLLHRRTRGDMRNHRKLFVIDGEIGYAGSQNIVDKDFRPGVTNRELVVRVVGPVVAAMTAVFVADWFLETETMLCDAVDVPAPAGAVVAQILPSGANYPLEGFATLLVWLIHTAQHSVVVTTPYLIPEEELMGAMRTAVLRGVRVSIIVSAVTDQRLVRLAQESYYEDLLAAGVSIYLFENFLLHAKNVSIDGRLSIIGSSNVDLRSFQLNEEVSLLIPDETTTMMLDATQDRAIEGSRQLLLEDWKRRSRPRRFAENLARLLSPLL